MSAYPCACSALQVAACICLFSLDKHEAIPVDTHVWKLATKYYATHLKGKSLTKKVHGEVQEAFEARFGRYAGWAHNTLFISELASMKARLPPGGGKVAGNAECELTSSEDGGMGGSDGSDGEWEGSVNQPATPEGVEKMATGAGSAAAADESLGAKRAKRRRVVPSKMGSFDV
jgi:N-glycosylase/DNA lyase